MEKNKIQDVIYYILIVIAIIELVAGTVKILVFSGNVSAQLIINCCASGGIFLILSVFVKLFFLMQDLSTILSIAAIVMGFFVFYKGIFETENILREGCFTVSGSLFGFGAGLPIGKVYAKRVSTK